MKIEETDINASNMNRYISMYNTKLRVSGWKFLFIIIPASALAFTTFIKSRQLYYYGLKSYYDYRIQSFEKNLFEKNEELINLYESIIKSESNASLDDSLNRSPFNEFNSNKIKDIKESILKDSSRNTTLVPDIIKQEDIKNYSESINEETKKIHNNLVSLYEKKIALHWKDEARQLDYTSKLCLINNFILERGTGNILKKKLSLKESDIIGQMKGLVYDSLLSIFLFTTRRLFKIITEAHNQSCIYNEALKKARLRYYFHVKVVYGIDLYPEVGINSMNLNLTNIRRNEQI